MTVPEVPGSFKSFCSSLGKRNITEFNYRYAAAESAQVFVGLSVAPGGSDLADLLRSLEEKGYQAEDLTDNEMAKLHIRHMVGGHVPPSIKDERVYRFEFPERPGALLRFLNGLGQRWNISLFHYRNHGAAFGRILVGLQVPRGERKSLEESLAKINYRHWDETENPAYQLYLAGRPKP